MKSLIKKFLTLTLLLCSVAAFAGNGNNGPRNFQQIIKSGELRIGVSIFPPWVMKAKDGRLIGSEIDMGRRLAADMGVTPKFGQYKWQQLIPALTKGKIDIIISGMAIKPDRALKVNFSRPYGNSGIGLATNTKLTKNIKNLDELKQPKIKIAVLANTVSADLAERLFSGATLVKVASAAEAEQALVKGKVDAIIAANPLPKFIALKHPGTVDLPLAHPLLSFKEGFAIHKGEYDFLNFLDSWIVARTADAWIPSTRRYWLESLDWKNQVKSVAGVR